MRAPEHPLLRTSISFDAMARELASPCFRFIRDITCVTLLCVQVLKAVETKSKEEIEHEQAREPHIQAVADARVRKQIHDHRLGTLVQSRGAYMKTKKCVRVGSQGAHTSSSHNRLGYPIRVYGHK